MRAALVALVVLGACQRDTRGESCATVRHVFDRHAPRAHGTPRRYYDYAPSSPPAETFDPDLARDLHAQHYADPDVAAAVTAVFDSAWTFYTPYFTEHAVPLDRLRALCRIPATQVTAL